MTPHTPDEWNPFVIMGNAMPPRDPKEVEEEEEDDEDEEDEEGEAAQEPLAPGALKLRVLT